MIKNQDNNSSAEENRVLYSWTFPEYEKHERSLSWYVLAFFIGSLLLLYSIITDNFLFAVIIIMVAIIIASSFKGEPLEMRFTITDKGIFLNKRFYDYKDLNKFWIVYNAPKIKKLYFEVDNSFHTTLVIPINSVSHLELRDDLGRYLEEDVEKEGEPISEALGRILKI